MTWLAATAAPPVFVNAAMGDWAWEYLRRNGDYRRIAAEVPAPMRKYDSEPALPIFHTSAADERASVWGLCSFRRP